MRLRQRPVPLLLASEFSAGLARAALAILTQTNSLIGSLCNAYAQDLGSFLAMGTNNIAVLLTNLNPDLIIYEQKKMFGSHNWPRRWPGCLRPTPPMRMYTVCSPDNQQRAMGLSTPNPTNGSYAVAVVDRSIALATDGPMWTIHTAERQTGLRSRLTDCIGQSLFTSTTRAALCGIDHCSWVRVAGFALRVGQEVTRFSNTVPFSSEAQTTSPSFRAKTWRLAKAGGA